MLCFPLVRNSSKVQKRQDFDWKIAEKASQTTAFSVTQWIQSHLSLMGLSSVCLTHFPTLAVLYFAAHVPNPWPRQFPCHLRATALKSWCSDHKSPCHPEKLSSWQNAAASVLITDQIWYFNLHWKNGLSTQLLFGANHNSTVGCKPCHYWDNWVLCWE